MKDYIIVEDDWNIILRFNNLIIEIFQDLSKKDYAKVQINYEELIKLYAKLVISEEQKEALGNLLNEINSKIEFDSLKQGINKEIKEYRLVKAKEPEPKYE